MSKNHSSPGQVLQNCYDEPNKALRTTATAVIAGNIDVEVDAADGDNVAISDGVNTLGIEPDGSINVNISNLEIDIEVNAADGDSVAISDGVNNLAVESDGSINVNVSSLNVPSITNYATVANIENTLTLLAGTKKVSLKTRGVTRLQIATTMGQSNTSFFTVDAGVTYVLENLKLTSNVDLYYQTSRDSVLEVFTWS